ncbi:MAG: GNAT family N-acetyltransferase [Anaerolineae bacterium]|nr:GNAT family N-acetyltransferase [Anaerolineae bacterium]
MQVSIRRATAEDYDGVCELLAEVDALHAERLPHIFQRADGPARERDYYHGLLADERVGLFVAQAGEALVGFAHAVITHAPPIPLLVPRRHALVDTIGVRSGFRRRGIGRMLLDAVEEWAIPRGATSIELSVYEFNEGAIAFYQRLGYETLRRRMSKTLQP